MSGFDVLAASWFALHGSAPFTTRTLIAAAVECPEIGRALRAMTRYPNEPRLSSHRVTRALHEREYQPAATVYALLPIEGEEGMWRFVQSDLATEELAA